MSMNVSSGDSEIDEKPMSEINTTPLVDVMLVLLIIFLITIPVVITTVPVTLPKATNQATVTKPENVVIAVDANGNEIRGDGTVDDRFVWFTVLQVQGQTGATGTLMRIAKTAQNGAAQDVAPATTISVGGSPRWSSTDPISPSRSTRSWSRARASASRRW